MKQLRNLYRSFSTQRRQRRPFAAPIALVGVIAGALLIGSLSPVTVQAAGAPGKLFLSPASTSVGQGATVTTQVRLDTGGDTMNAVQANFSYPTTMLEFTAISDSGSAFKIKAPSTGGNGSVSIARADFEGAKGDVLIATVTFKAIGTGTAELEFTTGSEAYRAGDSTNAVGNNVGSKVTIGKSGTSPSTPPAASTGEDEDEDNSDSNSSKSLSALPSDESDNTVNLDEDAQSGGAANGKKSGGAWWIIPVILVVVAGGAGAFVYLQRRRATNYDGYGEGYGDNYDFPDNSLYNPGGSTGVAASTPSAYGSSPASPVDSSMSQPASSNPYNSQSTSPQPYVNSFTGTTTPTVTPTSWQPTLNTQSPASAAHTPPQSAAMPFTPASSYAPEPVQPLTPTPSSEPVFVSSSTSAPSSEATMPDFAPSTPLEESAPVTSPEPVEPPSSIVPSTPPPVSSPATKDGPEDVTVQLNK